MTRGNSLRFALAIGMAAANVAAAADLRLIDAVKRRDAKAFDTLLANGADINAPAPDGATALSWAVFLDLQDLAQKLIARGAKVNTTGDYGETPFTLALANGNAALAEQLLKVGADWKATRWNGETPLMIAAGVGSVEEVRMLLDLGADVNGTDPNRLQNALMWAASEGHLEVLDLLIQKGANVKAVTKSRFYCAGFRHSEGRGLFGKPPAAGRRGRQLNPSWRDPDPRPGHRQPELRSRPRATRCRRRSERGRPHRQNASPFGRAGRLPGACSETPDKGSEG